MPASGLVSCDAAARAAGATQSAGRIGSLTVDDTGTATSCEGVRRGDVTVPASKEEVVLDASLRQLDKKPYN